MRPTSFFSTLLFVLPLSALAFPNPIPNVQPDAEEGQVQIPLSFPFMQHFYTLNVPNPFSKLGDEGDICPDLKVSCVNKDGKTVGDIGKKPFCRHGLTCSQCHQGRNTAECNAKFIPECKAQCEAEGPLGGK